MRSKLANIAWNVGAGILAGVFASGVGGFLSLPLGIGALIVLGSGVVLTKKNNPEIKLMPVILLSAAMATGYFAREKHLSEMDNGNNPLSAKNRLTEQFGKVINYQDPAIKLGTSVTNDTQLSTQQKNGGLVRDQYPHTL